MGNHFKILTVETAYYNSNIYIHTGDARSVTVIEVKMITVTRVQILVEAAFHIVLISLGNYFLFSYW